MTSEVVRKMCKRKKRYNTELEAIHAAINSSISFAKPMRPYRCPICHKFHLTSKVR